MSLDAQIHKPILLGALVIFCDENKKTKPSLRFEIRFRFFLKLDLSEWYLWVNDVYDTDEQKRSVRYKVDCC